METEKKIEKLQNIRKELSLLIVDNIKDSEMAYYKNILRASDCLIHSISFLKNPIKAEKINQKCNPAK